MKEIFEKPEITFCDVNKKLFVLNEKIANLKDSLCKNLDIVSAVKVLEESLSDFKAFMKNFNEQNFCHIDEFDNVEINVKNNVETAKENDEYKKNSYALIKECFDALERQTEIKDRNKISSVLWKIKEKVEGTIPYKIYGFRRLDNENKWQLIGFSETLKEAYFYLENDRRHYAKHNDTEYREDYDPKGYVQHMFIEPDDECTLAEFKIEGENFIEYFSTKAEGPLLKFAKYVRAEGICYFCKKTFDGHGKTCRPVQHQSSINFGLKRCCPECEEKYLNPAKKDEKLSDKVRRQFLFERPEYERR